MRNILTVILVSIFTSSILAQENNHLNALNYNFDKVYEHYYTNTDSALYYLKKVKEQARSYNEIDYFIEALITENWAANATYNLALMRKTLKQFDSVLIKNAVYIKTLDQGNYYQAAYQYSNALYAYELADFKKALINFKFLISTIEAIPDFESHTDIFNLYITAHNFIAKIYTIEQQYKLAKQYYDESLRNIKSNPETNKALASSIYILLSEIHEKEGNFEQANASILKNIPYHTLVSKNSNRIISSYQGVVNNHINLKQLDSAKFYVQLMKANLTPKHAFRHKYHEAKAKIFEAENSYSQAEKELIAALNLIKQKWQDETHTDVAKAYNAIGLLHAKFNNPKAALENYNLALKQLSKNNTNTSINQTVVLKILKNKTQILNVLENYSESLLTANNAMETLDFLKPTFKNNSDKLFLMADAFPVFESALEANFELHKKTKQDSLIDHAFYASEKSKSVLLMEALLSTKATDFANIPKKIIEQEQILRSQITHLEKLLNTSENTDLESELFETNTSYRELITTIETNYKTYYDLKYNSEVITLSELQRFLKPDTALISYFYGNDAIYSIVITKKSKSLHQLKRDAQVDERIISVYNMLNNPKSDIHELNNKSFQVYSQLVAPSLDAISEKNIIIITDGLLNYLPFSGLSTTGAAKYLVANRAISYVNSATLLQQLSYKKPLNTNVLAFAPSFDGPNSNNLLALPNNKKEATNILNYFSGKTLTDNQATLQNFNKISADYGILHFATHAILDDKNPEYSYLAFQPDSTNNLLYVSDLYNLNTNTSLVTLSACESGLGDLKRGEGFISLARGFYFSGAKSIASTLWKINDGSSLKIMDVFYKNLSEGADKNTALQKAQVSFIHANNQNALSHPYYWSGFVISGNMQAIQTTHNWIWYTSGIISLLALYYLFITFRKSN
ncbi:CHAT domain-containing protein [Bizionia sediminis]|uniref:CHAT domain-containing protein n=1 Tax=Bizionia sediminis TaxID=1737064 RepID=A0ABW5KU28_9FLAO